MFDIFLQLFVEPSPDRDDVPRSFLLYRRTIDLAQERNPSIFGMMDEMMDDAVSDVGSGAFALNEAYFWTTKIALEVMDSEAAKLRNVLQPKIRNEYPKFYRGVPISPPKHHRSYKGIQVRECEDGRFSTFSRNKEAA